VHTDSSHFRLRNNQEILFVHQSRSWGNTAIAGADFQRPKAENYQYLAAFI
jgi:hypothetical protein